MREDLIHPADPLSLDQRLSVPTSRRQGAALSGSARGQRSLPCRRRGHPGQGPQRYPAVGATAPALRERGVEAISVLDVDGLRIPAEGVIYARGGVTFLAGQSGV